jgi:hypothetical protein
MTTTDIRTDSQIMFHTLLIFQNCLFDQINKSLKVFNFVCNAKK